MQVISATEPEEKQLSPAMKKWGEAARGGFQLVPDLLLKNQSELGLNACIHPVGTAG